MAKIGKTVLLAILGVMVALVVFHLGPRLGFGEGRRIRAEYKLADGTVLKLVQFRNDNVVEAYTVRLYREGPGGQEDCYQLGFEDSYWWFPKFSVRKETGEIEIRADGEVLFVYQPTRRTLRDTDSPSHTIASFSDGFTLFSEPTLSGSSLSAENFSQAFNAASPSAKRDMVVAAIDRGLIKRGMSLVVTRQLFGVALVEHTRDSTNSALSATVFFNPAIPAPKPMMSAIQEGWYCNFWFSSDDHLERYSLSNLHK